MNRNHKQGNPEMKTMNILTSKLRLLIFTLVFGLAAFACASGSEGDATHTPPLPTKASPTDTIMQIPTLSPTPRPSPTATLQPTEMPQPSPTTTPAACNPAQVLENLYDEFYSDQFVFISNGIFLPGKGPVLTLSFWFIDYNIIPQPGDDKNDTLNNAGTALESAFKAARYIEDIDPCVKEVFAALNPIVVDNNYNGWISLDFPTSVLPEKIDLNDEIWHDIMDRYVTLNYVRAEPPLPPGSPPAEACSWNTVHDTLDMQFAQSSNGNTNFFFVRDSHGNNVWAYLDSNNVVYSTDYLGEAVSLILDEIECLHPSPDNLIVRTVGDGVVLFSSRLPRVGIENKDLSQFLPFP
jgi:hypothetical protein